MGIKGLWNKIVKSPTEGFENDYEKLIQQLYKELKKTNNYFYGSLKMADSANYAQIKQEDNTFKVNLILYLPGQLYEVSRSLRKIDNWNKNREKIEVNQVRENILSALLRTKLTFTDEQLIQLMDSFNRNLDKDFRFSRWPIGFYLTQVQKHIKNQGLSSDFKKYLEELLNSSHFDGRKNYWGADLQKAKVKLEEILFHESGSDLVSPPYQLSEVDKFGPFVNTKIESIDPSESQFWFQFFHHALTATAGKPSKKYLTKSKEIVSSIGGAKFKSLAAEFMSFVIGLKAEETVHTHRWQGGEYNYSTWTFLEEKNALILKGMVWAMVQFHDTKSLAILGDLAERTFKKIPGVGPAAAGVGNAAIYVLANSKGLEGVSHLSRLKLKVTQNNTKKLIQKYLDECSAKLGISSEEIEEISIPDFGLIEGRKEVSFDDYTLVLEISGVGKTLQTWIKPDGKIQKSVPTFVKQSKKWNALHAKTKEEAKKIQKYTSAQRDRIDRSFILNRSIDLNTFDKYYLNHGLVSNIARKLIWMFDANGERHQAIYLNDHWENQAGETVELSSSSMVSLWHPIFDTTENVLQWRIRLEQLEWVQPIKQAYREIYILTDAEVNTKTYSNRMAAHLLKQHQFNSLAGIRNWKYQLMGAFDDGRDNEVASLSLPIWNMTAEYWINEVYADDAMNDTGIWDYIATDQVKFVRDNGETIDLVDVPPIVLSEVLRDADLFVGVASVGNDPSWQDSGGQRVREYQDYWNQYSFGDLNELAKTRKQVLERLIPRLKIKDVAKIDGKFLRVRGKIREYKIHIGSTNILMEPNDQYLCIVPARNASSDPKDIFLPFEGDRGLSLILSKAVLLSEDDKITDKTILNQINR